MNNAPKSDEKHKKSGNYIKSAVYGGLDGIITTFSIVSSIGGANFPNAIAITLILGLSNVLGDGISMALGDYLSTKSEIEFTAHERKRETWEVENNPKAEVDEMVELFKGKGYSEEDSRQVCDILSKHKDAWVDIMMVEELGLMTCDESPTKNGIVTFISFILFGIIPLCPYIIAYIFSLGTGIFIASVIVTGVTLVIIGTLKGLFTGQNLFKSGFEALVIGGIAAGATYLLGYLLEPLANGSPATLL